MSEKIKLIAMSLLLFCSVFIYAEEKSEIETADEVLVTASKKEKNIQDVPVSAVIIDEKEVKETTAQNIAEILRDIPGVEIATTASNGMKYVCIRGESSRRTLLLIDGQPMSLQKSMDGPMAMLGKSQIERIEVVKGPVSVLYGSEAIGGVVNIITKKGGDKPFGGSVNYSYDTATEGFRGDNVINGSVNGIEYTFTYGLSRYGDTETADGTLDNNGEDRLSGTGSETDEYSAYLGYKNDKLHTGAKFEVYQSEYEVYTDLEELGFPSGPVQDMYMDIPKSDRTKGSAFIKLFELNDFIPVVSLDTYYQYTERDFDIFMDYFFQPGPVTMDYLGQTATHNVQKTIGMNFQSDFAFGPHYLVSGIDFKRDDIDGTEKSYTYEGSVGVPADEKYEYDSWLNTYALFVQDEWEVLDNFAVTSGGRFTFISSELVGTDDPGMTLQEGDSTDWNLSFSLASIYHITDDFSVRGSYGSGYRHPNLVELYIGAPAHGMGSAIAGNPDLDPETSHSFELGTNYEGKYFYADIAAFFTTAKDYISTDDTEYINIGGADTIGAELSLSVDTHFYNITPYSDLTVMRKKYDYGSDSDVEDTWKSGTPFFSGRYGVRQSQKFGKNAVLGSDLYSRFASAADLEYSSGTEEEYDGWGILCFKTGLSYKDMLNIYAGADNILDKEYEPTGELTAPGRSFFIGAGYSF